MGEGKDSAATLLGTQRLADAVRSAKIAAAHRSDVIVDIREADRARLEILAEELQPIFDDVPDDYDFFDFTVSGGAHPRLWIDGTAHVVMARDRRTYRFVRETRLGRVQLAESPDTRVVAERVIDYIAERIVERERAFASDDGISEKVIRRNRQAETEAADAEPLRARAEPKSTGFVAGLVWFLIGIAAGAGALYAYAVSQGFVI